MNLRDKFDKIIKVAGVIAISPYVIGLTIRQLSLLF